VYVPAELDVVQVGVRLEQIPHVQQRDLADQGPVQLGDPPRRPRLLPHCGGGDHIGVEGHLGHHLDRGQLESHHRLLAARGVRHFHLTGKVIWQWCPGQRELEVCLHALPVPLPPPNGDRLHPTVVVLDLAAMGPHRLIVSSTLLPDPLLAQHLGTVVLVPGALERLPSRGEAPLETPSCPEQSRERTAAASPTARLPSAPSGPFAPPPAEQAAPVRTTLGNLAKAFGEVAGFVGNDGNQIAEFAVGAPSAATCNP
jgi:hypothetical protein